MRQRLVQDRPESLAYQMDLAATLVGLARLDQMAGRPEQARQLWLQAAPFLTRVVEQRPDDRQAWKDLGIVRAELGESEAAATAFARLLELAPESHRAAILIDLATLDRKAGRLEQSRRWWEKVLPIRAQAVAQRPDDLQARKDLGIAHAELRQPEAAARAFTRVMKLTPEANDEFLWWSPDRTGIGAALADHDEIFGRVVEARPRDRNLLIARFHYFGRRRRWKEAAEIVARIIELYPNEGMARGYYRALLLFTGDVEGYRRANREARAVGMEDDLTFQEPTQYLGQSPVAPQRKPEPIHSAGANLSDHWGSQALGIRAYRDGRFTDAVRHLQEVPKLTEHPYVLTLNGFFLAMAQQRLGQVAEAR